jgi:phenylalanyl-tRNA synthetase beta subunit
VTVEEMLHRVHLKYRELVAEQAGHEAWAYILGGMDPDVTEDTVGVYLRAILGQNFLNASRVASEFLRGYVTRSDEPALPPVWHRAIGEYRIYVGVAT